MEAIRPDEPGLHVFPASARRTAPSAVFPKHWNKLVKGTALEGITAHVLRHSFASIANDLGFTEVTIAALLGHSKGTMTSKYIHTMDSALIMAADTIAQATSKPCSMGRVQADNLCVRPYIAPQSSPALPGATART
ncbi:MAG: tyrosine-type recombinase/integrase [Sphingomonadaceae bacterium]